MYLHRSHTHEVGPGKRIIEGIWSRGQIKIQGLALEIRKNSPIRGKEEKPGSRMEQS